jgi:hypothetical protein
MKPDAFPKNGIVIGAFSSRLPRLVLGCEGTAGKVAVK